MTVRLAQHMARPDYMSRAVWSVKFAPQALAIFLVLSSTRWRDDSALGRVQQHAKIRNHTDPSRLKCGRCRPMSVLLSRARPPTLHCYSAAVMRSRGAYTGGTTALHYSAMLGHSEMSKALVEAGADPHITLVEGEAFRRVLCN